MDLPAVVWQHEKRLLTDQELARVRTYFAPRSVQWYADDTYLITGASGDDDSPPDDSRLYHATSLRMVAQFAWLKPMPSKALIEN